MLEPEGREEARAALRDYYREGERTEGGPIGLEGEYLITLGTKRE